MKSNNFSVAIVSLAALSLLLSGCKELGGGNGGSSDSRRIKVPVEDVEKPAEDNFCEDDNQVFGLDWAKVYPKHNAEDVATGSYILARFTHEPDADSLNNATFGLQTVDDAAEDVPLTATINGQDVSFKPEGDHLREDTTYRFFMNADGEDGIAAAECEGGDNDSKYLVFVDEYGEPLEDEAGDPITEQENEFFTGEIDYLEVAYTVPNDGDENVKLDVEPVVVFNQPVNPDGFTCSDEAAEVSEPGEDEQYGDSIILVEADSGDQLQGACTLTDDGTKATFVPAEDLLPDSEYTLIAFGLEIEPLAENVDPMGTEEATFTTLAELAIVATTPEDGDENILPSVNPSVEFNQPITIDDDCPISLTSNGSDVDGDCELSDDGTEVSFIPDEELDEGDHQLVIEADKVTPEDEDGGELSDDVEIDFSVGDGSLAVVRTQPEDGDQTVDENVEPEVTFNQPVAFDSDDCPLTLEALDQNDNPDVVSGDCASSDDDTSITLTLDDSLDKGTHHHLTVDRNKVDPQGGGDGMDDDKQIEFRTDGEGPLKLSSCDVKVSGLCVLGGDGGDDGLADLLLDEDDGPLAPLASQIGGKDKLVDALETLLENEDGDLPTLLENLFLEGNLQDGLEQLLISEHGLQSILPELLMGDGEDNAGLQDLLASDDGAKGLLEALLIPTDEESDDGCASPLGTVCLVAGKDNDKKGVLDLLLGDDSELGNQGLSTQELVDVLGNTLGDNEDLGQTVADLFLEGNLQDGLEKLFIGDDEGGPALLQTLEDLGIGLVEGLCNVVGGLLGLGTCS